MIHVKPFLLFFLSVSCLNLYAAENTTSGQKQRGIISVRAKEKNQSDAAPTFRITDKKSRLELNIGGFIKPIAGWDIGNVVDDILFMPSEIPVPAAQGNKSNYFCNPLHSALEFHLVGMPGSRNQMGAYIQIMYNAPKNTLQVHHIYLTYRGWLLGKTTTLFSDGRAMPITIDPQGPNGAIYAPSYRISYQMGERTGFQFGISLEQPSFTAYPNDYRGKDYPDLDGKQYYANASQPVPDIPAYIQYTGVGDNHIRISGILRNFFYRDLRLDKTRSIAGWGIQISGNYAPVKPLIFYFQGAYGKGIGNYIQDINGLPLSYIPKDQDPGRMTPTPMMGLVGGIRYQSPQKWAMGYCYSQVRLWDIGYYAPAYRYGQYMAANLFYPLNRAMTWGLEWLWGRRKEYSGTSSHVNRIQTMVKLSF